MKRQRVWLIALGITMATAVLLLATEPSMSIAWDEGFTLGREERVRLWLRAMRDPAAFASNWRRPSPGVELLMPDGTTPPLRHEVDSRHKLLFDRRVVQWFWPFAREEPHGHPPFYALVGLLGDLLAPAWQDLPRARLGPILFFSFTAGAIGLFVSARWGEWPAAAAAGAWVLHPQLFGPAHYATYDAILSALWVLATLVFVVAVAPGAGTMAVRTGWSIALGVVLGCAAATKLTGWFLPFPFLIWTGLYRCRQALITLAIGIPVALLLVYALDPPWWTAPLDSLTRFLISNTTRGATIPIPVSFLRRVYDTPIESLPWYNTLVWTVFVTPVGFLILAAMGTYSSAVHWKSDSVGPLIAIHWAFLMLLRSLPHTPGHDGVRLFLPAFGLLALLAGVGARALFDRWPRSGKAVISLAILEGAISICVMMPVPLSYFSPLVGGLPGAAALGMEPTYYWEALTKDAQLWLRENTPPGRTIAFYSFPHSFLYLRRTGALPPRLARVDPGKPIWYVIQNRPGNLSDDDRALIALARPAFVVFKLGVPLIWIFRYSEFELLNLKRAGERTR
jgi:4-amino-4-deoxy-L-arabinose transferase-like glycosyltransferase